MTYGCINVYTIGMNTSLTKKKTTMPKVPRSKATFHLPTDLWKKTKIEAINRDIDAQDIVAEALRLWFHKEEKK